jgi:hypothetical protein
VRGLDREDRWPGAEPDVRHLHRTDRRDDRVQGGPGAGDDTATGPLVVLQQPDKILVVEVEVFVPRVPEDHGVIRRQIRQAADIADPEEGDGEAVDQGVFQLGRDQIGGRELVVSVDDEDFLCVAGRQAREKRGEEHGDLMWL